MVQKKGSKAGLSAKPPFVLRKGSKEGSKERFKQDPEQNHHLY